MPTCGIADRRQLRLGEGQLVEGKPQRGAACRGGRRSRGYPHLFVLDAGGALLHSQDTGVLEAGRGYDKAKFVAFLKRWMTAGRP